MVQTRKRRRVKRARIRSVSADGRERLKSVLIPLMHATAVFPHAASK